MILNKYRMYQKTGLQPLRPYIQDEDLTDVSVRQGDIVEIGGMIAVNVKNPEDKWYISKKFFEENYTETSDHNNRSLDEVLQENERLKNEVRKMSALIDKLNSKIGE